MGPASRDLRLPSIDGLRAFEAAARLGTFERAADELAITASAVSKRVATLEELLGTGLLVRTGKTLALTASGKEYLAQVRAALGLLAAMPLHQRRAQHRERLRVTPSSPPSKTCACWPSSACRACSTTTPTAAAGPRHLPRQRNDFQKIKLRQRVAVNMENRSTPPPWSARREDAGGHRAHRA
jgi:DNA-binding MarR family transcriptional regulator